MTQPYSGTFYSLGVQFQRVTYTGDGAAAHVISVPFKARLVFITETPYTALQRNAVVLVSDTDMMSVEVGAAAGTAAAGSPPLNTAVTATGIDVGTASTLGALGPLNVNGINYIMYIIG